MARLDDVKKKLDGLNKGEIAGWITDLEKDIQNQDPAPNREKLPGDSRQELLDLCLDIENYAFEIEREEEVDYNDAIDRLLRFASKLKATVVAYG